MNARKHVILKLTPLEVQMLARMDNYADANGDFAQWTKESGSSPAQLRAIISARKKLWTASVEADRLAEGGQR